MRSQAIKRFVQKFNAKLFANKAFQLAGKSEIRIRSLVSSSYTPDVLFRRVKKANGLSTLSLLVSRRLVWFRLCPFGLFPFRIVSGGRLGFSCLGRLSTWHTRPLHGRFASGLCTRVCVHFRCARFVYSRFVCLPWSCLSPTWVAID